MHETLDIQGFRRGGEGRSQSLLTSYQAFINHLKIVERKDVVKAKFNEPEVYRPYLPYLTRV